MLARVLPFRMFICSQVTLSLAGVEQQWKTPNVNKTRFYCQERLNIFMETRPPPRTSCTTRNALMYTNAFIKAMIAPATLKRCPPLAYVAVQILSFYPYYAY